VSKLQTRPGEWEKLHIPKWRTFASKQDDEVRFLQYICANIVMIIWQILSAIMW